MKEFNQICKEFENLDIIQYSAILTKKSLDIIPALSLITEDGLAGTAIFATFILSAITCDGKLSEEEYLLCYPLLKVFFKEEVNYKDCQLLLKKMKAENKELKKLVNEMIDILGKLSDDLKNDLILVCLMICAIDGKASLKEKAWIKQLIQ